MTTDRSEPARPEPVRREPGRRGAPPLAERLSRDDVVIRATRIIERDGLDTFSLRRLAADIGVRPSALYNHIGGRDDLLDAVAQAAVEQLKVPGTAGPWPQWLQTVAHQLRNWLLDRPGIAGLILARAGSTSAGSGLLALVLDRLETSGVDRAVAHLAWHLVLTLVVGSVQQDLVRGRHSDQEFAAVLAMAVDGVVASAARPPDAAARHLLDEHEVGSAG